LERTLPSIYEFFPGNHCGVTYLRESTSRFEQYRCTRFFYCILMTEVCLWPQEITLLAANSDIRKEYDPVKESLCSTIKECTHMIQSNLDKC
jgi:hypothetical protein